MMTKDEELRKMLLNYKCRVGEISAHSAMDYIKEHHSKHNCCSNLYASYGLFVEKDGGLFGTEEQLVGVIAYRRPWNKKVSKNIFGEECANDVLEIHRVCITYGIGFDLCGFELLIGESIKQLRERNIKGIVAYTPQGVLGTIFWEFGFVKCFGKHKSDYNGLVRYVKLLYKNEEEHSALVSKCKVKEVLEDERYKLTRIRDNEIDDFLKEFGNKWKKQRELRFGQLLSNVFNNNDLFYTKDEEILEKLRSFCEKGV